MPTGKFLQPPPLEAWMGERTYFYVEQRFGEMWLYVTNYVVSGDVVSGILKSTVEYDADLLPLSASLGLPLDASGQTRAGKYETLMDGIDRRIVSSLPLRDLIGVDWAKLQLAWRTYGSLLSLIEMLEGLTASIDLDDLRVIFWSDAEYNGSTMIVQRATTDAPETALEVALEAVVI